MHSPTRAIILAACLSVTAPMALADTHETSSALVTNFFEALSNKDFDTIQAMFTEDADVLLPFAAGQGTTAAPIVFAGLDQVMGYYHGAGERIAEVGFTDAEILVSEDASVVFVENVGAMVLPDGRDYANRYVWRFTIEDGQISEVREYYDPKVADTAFGRS